MLRRIAATVAAIAAVVVLSQCSKDKTTSPELAPLNQPLTLTLGQSAAFGDEELYVTFESLNFDERCQGETDCLWDGVAEITVRLRNSSGQQHSLDLAITGDASAADQRNWSRESLGHEIVLDGLEVPAAGLSTDAKPTATILVRQANGASTPPVEMVITIRRFDEKVLGNDVSIGAIGLNGDMLTLTTSTAGNCVPHYFALFAVDSLAGTGGDVINLYVKHLARSAACANNVSHELRFDISPLRELLTNNRPQVFLNIHGCLDSLAMNPRQVMYPASNAANRPPVLEPIGTTHFAVGVESRFAIVAIDPEGEEVRITFSHMPRNARVVRTVDTTCFIFQPDERQIGWHDILVIASDGVMIDSERVNLHTTRTGFNSPPELTVPAQLTIAEDSLLMLRINACDPDSDQVTIIAHELPENAYFGIAYGAGDNLLFQPSFAQAGSYIIWFVASDGIAADTAILFLQVTNVDRAPVIHWLPAVARVRVGERLTFSFRVSDPDGEDVFVNCLNLPERASLTTTSPDLWTFSFDPDSSQLGCHEMRFVATAGSLADTATLNVEAYDNSSIVTIDAIDTQEVREGDSMLIAISASSSRNAPVSLQATALGGLSIARFKDFRDGHAEFVVRPGYRAAGVYGFRVTASDYYDADTAIVAVTVNEAGDQPPRFAANPFVLHAAAGVEKSFQIGAYDPDGDSVMCAATAAPEFVLVEYVAGRWMLRIHPAGSDIGRHQFTITAADADNPLLTATLEVDITVHVLEENSGSLMPGAIGNYWVYERTSHEGYMRGAYGTGTEYCLTRTRIDSVAIVDSVTTNGDLHWIQSDGTRFYFHGDTLIYPCTSCPGPLRFYPKEGFSNYDYKCYKYNAPLVVPAGAFSEVYGYRSTSMYSPRYFSEYALGIGLVASGYSSLTGSVRECEYGCSYSGYREVLLRYKVR